MPAPFAYICGIQSTSISMGNEPSVIAITEEKVYRPAYEQGILDARDAGLVNLRTSPEELQRIGHEAGQQALRELLVPDQQERKCI